MTSEKEVEEKRKAVQNYRLGEQCRPDDLDSAPPGDSMPNYPDPHPQYGYNFEDKDYTILDMTADGHHGPNRWDLTQNEIGTTDHPQHEHSDLKRLPPTIYQTNPDEAKIGYLANYTVPEHPPDKE